MATIGLLKKLKHRYDSFTEEARAKACKKSYSQSGEDLIIDYIFTNYLHIQKPTYLDIGAHHPTYLSNTYLFYRKGCSGVCVEPDKSLYEGIRKKRKNDKCLNIGVGLTGTASASFYVMSEKTLNTFSQEEAERYQSYGHYRIKETLQVDLLPINTIIAQNFSPYPNLISLDVEGLDYEILKSMDFEKYRPEVFCIETLTFAQDKSERKLDEIILLMQGNGYFVYADTYINTIFVDNEAWRNRQ